MQVIEYHQKTSCWKPLKTQKTSENQENHHNNWLLDPVYHTWERDSVGDIPTFRIGPSNDLSHALTHHTTISCNPRKYHIPWRHPWARTKWTCPTRLRRDPIVVRSWTTRQHVWSGGLGSTPAWTIPIQALMSQNKRDCRTNTPTWRAQKGKCIA